MLQHVSPEPHGHFTGQLAADPADSNLHGRPEPFLQEAAVGRRLSAGIIRGGGLKSGRQTVAETNDRHGSLR